MTEFLDKTGLKTLWVKIKAEDGKRIAASEKGAKGGVASLDANGRIPVEQLANLDTTFAEVVTALPTSGIKKHLYLIKSDKTGDKNIYKEYLYTGDVNAAYDETKWEELGEYQSEVDLSDYSKKNETLTGVLIKPNETDVNIALYNADNSETTAKIDAATSTSAGAMSAQDKKNIDRLIADTYPFGITSFNNNSGGVLEKGTTKSFSLNWGFKNLDYNKVTSQVISGGSLNTPASIAVGTLTYAIANLTDATTDAAKTFTYTLTAKSGDNTKTAQTSVTFVHRSYAGVVAADKTSLTAADIKALANQVVQNSKSRTVSLSQNNQKIAYCYPAYLGNLSSIKDGNGFQGFGGYTKSQVTVDGVVYNVYLQNTAAISSGSYTFA